MKIGGLSSLGMVYRLIFFMIIKASSNNGSSESFKNLYITYSSSIYKNQNHSVKLYVFCFYQTQT